MRLVGGSRRAQALISAFLAVLCSAGLAAATRRIEPSQCAAAAAAPAEPERLVTLLVHGMTLWEDDPETVWGELRPAGVDGSAEDASAARRGPRWTGLIGHLDERGQRFGGVIRPAGDDLDLPADLEASGTHGDPRSADVFALAFSRAANTDGLAMKGLEVAAAVDAVRRFAGASRVRVVAYSAGGLAARAYVQGALPGLPFRHDVSHLVTVATPHLGSDLAGSWGELLGTRATSLDRDAALVQRLNVELPLPSDVRFASVVVRGFAADVRAETDDYDASLDREFLEPLPISFRAGGDQVVHVVSQNLALARTARRYESETRRPVQFAVVRVDDPSPADIPCLGRRVHTAALETPAVQRQTVRFLHDETWWSPGDEGARRARIDEQARQCARDVLEEQALGRVWLGEVQHVDLDECARLDGVAAPDGATRVRYRFAGRARAKGRVLRVCRRTTQVEGTLEVEADSFGRVVACVPQIDDRSRWWW